MDLAAQSRAVAALQADFVGFMLGALALAAALVFLFQGRKPGWPAVALFALLQGAAAWLDIFVWSLPSSPILPPWIAGLRILSAVFLLKAAGSVVAAGKRSAARPRWLPIAVGLGGLLLLAQLSIQLRPVLADMVWLAGAAPVTWLQVTEFCLLLLLLLVAMAADAGYMTVASSKLGAARLIGMGILGALFSLGGWATGYIASDTDAELRENLRSQVAIAALSVKPELIAAFDRYCQSGETTAYHFVNPELQAIKQANPAIAGLYVLVGRQEEILFAYSADAETVSGNAAGNRYRRYPPQLSRTFATGDTAIVGAYTDEWGEFVSGFAAVRDHPDGKILAILGMDIAAADWKIVIFRHRLAPLCLSMLLVLISLLVYGGRRRLLTAAARTEASEERFSLAMQGANDGLWDWNVVTGEVYFSPQWKRMLGLDPAAPLSDLRQWTELIHPADRQETLLQLKGYLRGRIDRLEREIRMHHSDGHYIDVLARAFVVRRPDDAKPVRVVGTQVDITERKAAAREVLRAKEAAEQAARARSAFLANMSHEIRTPIHAILGFTQLMQQDSALNREQLSQVETIRRSGEHLLALVNEVLEMSRLEAAKTELHPEVFSLPEFLAEIPAMFQGQIQEKGLQLVNRDVLSPCEQVSADKQKLRQILLNLLGNAVKFTAAGWIEVMARTEPLAESDSHCRLFWEVSDSGPGIAAEDRERIFLPFMQAGGGDGSGGTGLGLAISREYARLMGGDIAVHSLAGHGSRFSLTVPLRIIGRAARELPPAAIAPASHTNAATPAAATVPLELLPPAIIAELKDSIRRVRLDECEVLIERLQADCPHTADILREHLQRYDYGKILALLDAADYSKTET